MDSNNKSFSNKEELAKKRKKNLGGRPKLKDSEKKNKILQCLFTEIEFKIAKNRLEEWGYKKFSDFVINALVYNRILCIKKVYLDEKTTISLNKIGNNINQISKNLNNNETDLNKLIPIFEEIKDQFIKLNDNLNT